MRTLKPYEYEIDRETCRYNPAAVIVYKNRRHAIGAGTSDDVDLFEEFGALFVLARNRSLQYVGLEVFRDGEMVADIFCDSYSEQAEYLNGLTAINAAKRLANWLDF